MAIDWNGSEFVFFQKQLREGRVSLFLGAGFSWDAKNASNERPPLGDPLAELMAKEGGFKFAGEKLPTVYGAVRKRIGDEKLFPMLRKHYEIRSFEDWYKVVRNITWHRIYTLNIDNLIQELYKHDGAQKLRTIINPSPVEERVERFPLLLMTQVQECVVESADKNRPAAWFTVALDHVVTHPSGRRWAGAAGNHLYLLQLEGTLPETGT